MDDASLIKIPFFAKREALPQLPDQPKGSTYALIWGSLDLPSNGLCYIAETFKGSQARLLAYITDSGMVFPTEKPVLKEPETKPSLAIAKKDGTAEGGIYVRSHAGDMVRIGMYDGTVKGPLSERSRNQQPASYNETHPLQYREFLATLFLHYCVFSPQAAREQIATEHSVEELDTTFGKLDAPVEIFAGFDTLALPDAIASALFCIDEKKAPCGLELYAREVLGSIDLARLRGLTARSRLTLSRIERTQSFFINFSRASLNDDDVAFIYSIEAALNRISCVLDAIGSQLAPVLNSPSEETCRALERTAFSHVTNQVSRLLDSADEENPWAKPGTVACAPGGEWDVRTRFAHAAEDVNPIVRLEYEFLYDGSRHGMRISLAPPLPAYLPDELYDPQTESCRTASEAEREHAAAEFGSRMALVMAAAGFSAGLSIERVTVELQAFCSAAHATYAFERSAFLAQLLPLSRALKDSPLLAQRAHTVLATYEIADDALDAKPAKAGARDNAVSSTTADAHTPALPTNPEVAIPSKANDPRFELPRKDARPLPAALRSLLLADTPQDLEVMELPTEMHLMRLNQLRAQLMMNPAEAEEGIHELIDELQAGCAAAELMADVPTVSLYSENYLSRMLMGLCFDDPATRIHRVPDALFNAQYEIANLYSRNDDYEHALPEARKLLDMAPTSSSAHFATINALARLNRFDEVIEVARHGLRYSFERDATAYYLYRMAYAYWNTDKPEVALACYRAIPRGEDISGTADEEMRALMASMGQHDEPTFAEAMARLNKEDIPIPPTVEVSSLLSDAAVMLTDAGFFFLASHCAYQLWRTLGSDDLNALHRSLIR